MRKSFLFLIAVFILMLFSACNIYDFTHAEGDSDDIGVLLSDAASAQYNNDYAGAARIYWKVLVLDPDNSRAMKGYSTAVTYRDVVLSDISKLMISIFEIQSNGSTNSFLSDLAGQSGMTLEAYKASVMLAVSNASYWRAPIHGIDRESGRISTNASGLPDSSLVSDGVISADDRNAFFNYLILKSVHVGLHIQQQQFAVYDSMTAGIDIYSMTNSLSAVSSSNDFRLWHISFTNKVYDLSNSYVSITNTMLDIGGNTSIPNLIGTIDCFVAALSNQMNQGDISGKLFDEASSVADELKSAMNRLTLTLTNTGTGIQEGFNQLSAFQTQVETDAIAAGWFPYAN